MAELSKSREAALRTLVKVEKDGAYLNIALRDILADFSMNAPDNALATTLAFGVVKNSIYLDNIIKNLSSVKLNKLSPWIHNILRIGIYSIRFLDRIPLSATVNECVRLAKRYGHKASSGYVNAMLRNAAKNGDFLPADKTSDEYISIRYSYPMWLVKKWREEGYGEELFSAMNNTPPVTVRKNTLKCDTLSESFEKAFSPYAYIYNGGGSVENTDEYKNGFITVQDEASQRAVGAIGVKENMRVLDLCSAPGGKSAFISQLMNNTGEIVCCDIHEHKLPLIENNFLRLGVTNARLLCNDATIVREEFTDSFDVVVCDVPCSGLGVIRRKPDIKWTKTPPDNDALSKIQKDILAAAALYTKKGGLLMYSTCTVNKSENEDNVKYFLENYPDFSLLPCFKTNGIQLLPHTDATDGFFYAIFERK